MASILTFSYPPTPAQAFNPAAASSANQVLEIAALNSIDATATDILTFSENIDINTSSIDVKTPPLGTAVIAASTPVNIASDQVVPVSGPLTDTQLRATAVPVSGPLTDTQLRATAVPVSGPLTDTQLRATAVPVSGPLTDAELRASPLPVSGTVTASNPSVDLSGNPAPTSSTQVAGQTTGGDLIPIKVNGSGVISVDASSATINVAGPLTDTELRATAVPVSGPLTDTQLRATAVPVSGPLTDTQLRATAVPVSGPLTDTQLRATAVPVSGPLTDTELRATAVPVSAAQSGTWNITNVSGTISLPTGASTAAKQPALGTAGSASSDVITVQGIASMTALKVDGSAVTQPVSVAATLTTSEEKSSSSSITSVASSASSVSLLASNSSRKNATFFNDSTQILYLKLGATASTTSYTVQIAAGGYYELPLGRIYTGAIDGIWASANGNVRITELS